MVVLCLVHNLTAQECGTEFLHENWRTTTYDNSRRVGQALRQERSSNAPYVIPIVFHVFHLGEPEGIGSNISSKYVQEALDRLNKNMAGENGNGLDMEVRFCLASRSPEGHSTNGINRIDGTRIPQYARYGARFGASDGASLKTIKGYSKWPVQDYYNVWIVTKIGGGTILGLASYPNGDDLDGMVIRHTSLQTDVFTHEIGHGFNLFHTFQGDNGEICPENSNCSQDGDEVCDTAPHRRFDCHDSACSTNRDLAISSNNFMSYCVGRNSFTQGQKQRFHDALFGPIRSSLLNSVGCSYINDYNLAMIEIVNHQNQFCDGRYYPKIRIRNQGAITLNSFVVKYKVSGQAEKTQILLTNLGYGEYGVFDLNPINVPDGFISFSVSLHSPNTFEDQQNHDNSLTTGIPFSPVDFVEPKIEEDFENLNYKLPDNWSKAANLSQVSKWNSIQNVNNGWLYVNGNFTQPSATIHDELTLPALDLASTKDINLSFDYAFGGNSQVDFSQTSLEVLVRLGCNGQSKSIWKLQGDALVTFTSGSLNNPSNYRKLSLNLDEFAGEKVFLTFRYSYNVAGSPSLNLDNLNLSSNVDTNSGNTNNDIDALPDLTLSNLRDHDTEIQSGEILNFYFDVNNFGEADVLGSYAISSYLSTDKNLSNSDIALERSFTGFTKVGTIPDLLGRIELPSILLGQFYLILKVDGDDNIEESNELNNILVSEKPIQVRPYSEPDHCEQEISGFDFIGNYKNASYYLSQNETHWNDASFQANQQGGYLLTINDKAENDFIQSNIDEIILIGLHDQYTEGTYAWHSGEAVNYLNFESNNSASNDFARMNFWDGKWAMDSRWVSRKFVLEFPCEENKLPNDIQLRGESGQMLRNTYELFPNPTNEVLNLDFFIGNLTSDKFHLEVLNTSGQSIYRSSKEVFAGENLIQLNVGDFSTGVYQLVIQTGKGERVVKRFVKM